MPGGTCRKVSTFLEEKGNAMKHERVACCHLYACMAELLGIKDLRIFVFCRHAGVSCANASLGAPTIPNEPIDFAEYFAGCGALSRGLREETPLHYENVFSLFSCVCFVFPCCLFCLTASGS